MDPVKKLDAKDVRKAIHDSAYTTTLTELQRRGRKQVKVIKGRRIYQLIAQAVDQVVEKTSLDIEQKKAMIEESRREFHRLVQAHHDEANRLRDAETALARAQARIEILERENNRLEEEVQTLRGQAVPGRDPMERDLLQKLVSDVSNLNGSLSEIRSGSIGQDKEELLAASSGLRDKFSSMLEDTMNQLSERFNSKLDRIEEEKAYKAVEAAEVALDGLFQGGESLESNFNNVEVRQASDEGITDVLTRLRNMKGTPGSGSGAPAQEDETGETPRS